MCGRYSLIVTIQAIAHRFGLAQPTVVWKPRYNLAPMQTALVITESMRLEEMRWGLMPHWSKLNQTSHSMMNARSESLQEKPSFKGLLKRNRCLVPADGFYEWKKEGSVKFPMRCVRKDRDLFAFAGLWDVWQKGDEVVHSFTIITAEANSLLRPVHERMPVILTKESEKLWLDSTIDEQKLLTSTLKPYPMDDMELYPVSPLVNSWKIDSVDCIKSTAD